MRSSLRAKLGRPGRLRSRFGYDHNWWGEAARDNVDDHSYWAQTRRPLPCLIFILPTLLAYELGVIWLGGDSTEALRTGADAWLRHGLAALGLVDKWFLPLSLVLALLAWQAADPREWRFAPTCLMGMAIESLVLAVSLIGLSRLVDLGFVHLEHKMLLAAGSNESRQIAASIISYLGAGVYEEALFRLALIPLFLACMKLLQTPTILAQTVAVTGSALLFSIAHHAGTPGEAFTWFAFIFRWLAGVFFAWVFVVRGFGVAVGTHTTYDILVGLLGWHF
jgi:Type II CAAX prenyl endopeptidase Rce1-like